MFIFLDTFPASSVSKQAGEKITISDLCRQWINQSEREGHQILVPAVVYYEVLRELELRGADQQIVRLKNYCLRPERFLPILTDHLELAAQLWARARTMGRPTADRVSLDADVILVAQVLSLGLSPSEFIIATTNPSHLSMFAPAKLWSEIEFES